MFWNDLLIAALQRRTLVRVGLRLVAVFVGVDRTGAAARARGAGADGSDLPSSTLRRLCSIARRAFTSLNSEVLTTYSGFGARIFWISSCAALMRSSVIGWVEKTLDSVPGFFFSSDWIFSKKSTNAVGS